MPKGVKLIKTRPYLRIYPGRRKLIPAPANHSGLSLETPLPAEASICTLGRTKKVMPPSKLLEGIELPERAVSPKNSTKNPILSVAEIPSATE